ncbi:MAG: hypothetical protein JRJ73_15000, partial [Deltaproteobacteria bacterium]|nr:hypothetical protein [Deltaproteobacteria bacterium]
RYLTQNETTIICEYFRNGAGFTTDEMGSFFSSVDKAYGLFLRSNDENSLIKTLSLSEAGYSRQNPMRDYLYLRISQKDPLNILYLTPSLTWIYNLNDNSFSLSPELLYKGITNLELRLKAGIIIGHRNTEYGEKQNDFKLEFRIRYYFD